MAVETRKCQVSVDTVQQVFGQKDTMAQSYDGNLRIGSDKHYVSYKNITEDGESSVLLEISRDQMRMVQKGALNSEMLFDVKGGTICRYTTPMGTLDLTIETLKYHFIFQKESIEVFLSYKIKQGCEELSQNDMRILIKPI